MQDLTLMDQVVGVDDKPNIDGQLKVVGMAGN